MELKQITHFIALSKLVSFTRAAEACNISQPAFSQSIRKLEEELGGALVVRDGRNTRLTPLGSILLQYCERLQRAENELKSAAQREAGDARLRLRIQVETISGLAKATAAAEAFLRRHADVSVLVTGDAAPGGGGEDALFDDAKIVFSNAPPISAAAHARELPPETFVALLPPSDPLAERRALAPEVFFQQRVIRWRGCPMLRTLEELAAALGMSADFRLVARDFFLAKHFVAAGLGVTLGPRSLASDGQVATVALDLEPLESSAFVYSVVSEGADAAARRGVAAFFDALDAVG